MAKKLNGFRPQQFSNELNSEVHYLYTGDEIAQIVGLTGVTVRRYMNYLAETGRVTSEMNYETGGRPCMRYQIN